MGSNLQPGRMGQIYDRRDTIATKCGGRNNKRDWLSLVDIAHLAQIHHNRHYTHTHTYIHSILMTLFLGNLHVACNRFATLNVRQCLVRLSCVWNIVTGQTQRGLVKWNCVNARHHVTARTWSRLHSILKISLNLFLNLPLHDVRPLRERIQIMTNRFNSFVCLCLKPMSSPHSQLSARYFNQQLCPRAIGEGSGSIISTPRNYI